MERFCDVRWLFEDAGVHDFGDEFPISTYVGRVSNELQSLNCEGFQLESDWRVKRAGMGNDLEAESRDSQRRVTVDTRKMLANTDGTGLASKLSGRG